MNQIKKIGVFTSGGDSPGMNAAVRAVVRTALYYNIEVVGIRRGYEGMINGEFVEMDRKSVANIIQRGGTILKTARSMAFMTPEGRKEAFNQLKGANIDALVAIGGDGTFTGAKILLVKLVNVFFSALPLSVAATFFPLNANNVRTTLERSTLCKSATISMFNFRKSENNRSKPKKPLCRSFKSTPKKYTLGIPSKKG